MATKDETNVKKLPAFSALKPHERFAVELKSDGKTYDEIVNTINAEYELAYKYNTVRGWFIAGGQLEAAYLEYITMLAEQSVREAKLKIKRLSSKAANTLEETMGDEYEGTVRVASAKALLNKYIPDRQLVLDEVPDDELPDSITNAADEVIDGQNKVDDAPKGENASEPDRDTSDQDIPT